MQNGRMCTSMKQEVAACCQFIVCARGKECKQIKRCVCQSVQVVQWSGEHIFYPNFRLRYNTILERHSPAQIARIPNGLCNKSIHFDLGCDGTDLPHLIMQECSNQNWRTFKFFIDDPRTAGCNFCQDGVGTAGQLPGLDLATKPLSCFRAVEGGTWKISTKRKWNFTTHQWPLSHVSCEFVLCKNLCVTISVP